MKFFEHLQPDSRDMVDGGPSSYDFTHMPVREKFIVHNEDDTLRTVYMSPKTMPLTPHLDLMSPEMMTKKQSMPVGPGGSRVMMLH